MRERVRNTGVYLVSANWQHITYLVGIAIGVAHYITPAMAAVIVPALAHHWAQALFAGRQALAQAAQRVHLDEYLKVFTGEGEGFSEAEKEEGK